MVSTLLLYQSPARQTHPSIPDQKTPLWMPYTVSLYPTTIILQVPNPGFSSSSKFQIPLSELYDVHSIVAKDLPPGSVPLPGTIALPSGFGDNIYVFEAQCYGGRIERFATPSMALRTTWVRHLLDVLAGKDPGSKNGDDPSDNVEEGVTSMPNGTPVRSPDSIQSLPSVSSLALASSHGTFASNPVSLPRGAAATIKAVESNFDSKPPTEKRSALMRLSTPTKPLSRIPDSRPSSVSSALRVASTLPNPWDPPTTPSRRPASSIVHRTSSLLSSPQSDRSRMTTSPSICRLDERNLVRNRLAMLERQASPSPSRSESVRNKGTKEGSVNWEALSEIRSGRSGSRLSRTTSGMRSPGIGLPPGVSFAERTHSNSGKFSRPMWPFPELVASSDTDSKLGGPILEPGVLRIGLATSRSASGFNTGPVKTRQEAVSPLFSLPRRRAMEPDSKSIQVLGNLHPSRNAQTGPLQSPPKPVTTSMQDPCIQRPILDRLSTLVSAIRESDVAHSTKVSGLGQLIASIQERIVQAVEDSTNIATAENAALVEHVEGLHGTLESLVTRPSLGTDERADLSSIKETIERIDQVISTKLQDSFGNHVKEDREMKTIIAEETDGLKRAVQDLALKLEHTSTQNSVLGKLDALTEIVTLAGVSPSRDVDFMTKFVQQVKDHISSLPAPNLDLPLMDISVIMEKLDLMSESMTNSTTPIDLSAIQAALEDIREFSQTQQISDASLASTTPQTDISDVLMKLDGITAMCQSIMVVRTGATDTETIQEEREAQQTLLNALKEDAEHRTAQAQQTAELVRYSNELNTWLEKFVTNASTQMDGVGAGLGALRRDLGLDPLSTDRQEDTNAGVIQELRAMFEEQIKSTGDIAATLSALLVAFNEEQARSAQARENLGRIWRD
ncbi:hypothetical protein B0J17DRAFT_358959 [Rhizoctonia solani]|nr:hypothetical protein B0J17DRAFT_358959 [Rhizoctonia solani]